MCEAVWSCVYDEKIFLKKRKYNTRQSIHKTQILWPAVNRSVSYKTMAKYPKSTKKLQQKELLPKYTAAKALQELNKCSDKYLQT